MATHAAMSVHAVSVEEVEILVEEFEGRNAHRVPVTWADLRAAATQGDEDLAPRYAAVLRRAREIARGMRDSYGSPIVGRWHRWRGEDNLWYERLVIGPLVWEEGDPRPPSIVGATRPADPDEVAAHHATIERADRDREALA